MIKTAIIGLGSVAQNIHLPLIKHETQLEVVAVCSSSPGRVQKLLGDVPCFTDLDSLLFDSDAELLVITTPNKYHYQMSLKALNAGRHVVVEKPVATEPKAMEALITAANRANKRLFPFHNRRWDGDFLTVKKLLEEQALGDIKLFESRFDRFRPDVTGKWKEQGGQDSGLWFDIGPHLLDQALQLFATPSAITARLLCTRKASQAVDYFHVQLHYTDKEVILSASNFCAGPVRRFYLEGSKGTYVKQGMDVQEAQLTQGITPNTKEYGLEDTSAYGTLYREGSNEKIIATPGQYPAFYQGVVDSILHNKTPLVSTGSAMLVTKFLQLGLLSQEQKKTIWVRQYRD